VVPQIRFTIETSDKAKCFSDPKIFVGCKAANATTVIKTTTTKTTMKTTITTMGRA